MTYTSKEILNFVLQGQKQDCVVKENISTLSLVSQRKFTLQHITKDLQEKTRTTTFPHHM